MAHHYDLYASLRLDRSAGSAQLRDALNQRLQELRSQGYPDNSPAYHEASTALSILGDENKKASYDARLADTTSPAMQISDLIAMADAPSTPSTSAPSSPYGTDGGNSAGAHRDQDATGIINTANQGSHVVSGSPSGSQPDSSSERRPAATGYGEPVQQAQSAQPEQGTSYTPAPGTTGGFGSAAAASSNQPNYQQNSGFYGQQTNNNPGGYASHPFGAPSASQNQNQGFAPQQNQPTPQRQQVEKKPAPVFDNPSFTELLGSVTGTAKFAAFTSMGIAVFSALWFLVTVLQAFMEDNVALFTSGGNNQYFGGFVMMAGAGVIPALLAVFGVVSSVAVLKGHSRTNGLILPIISIIGALLMLSHMKVLFAGDFTFLSIVEILACIALIAQAVLLFLPETADWFAGETRVKTPMAPSAPYGGFQNNQQNQQNQQNPFNSNGGWNS